MIRRSCMFTGILLIFGTPLQAQSVSQTETYTYDALGRLVKVEVTGGSSDGEQRNYQYDAASNRTQVTTSGGDSNNGGGGTQPPSSATLRPSFNGLFRLRRI